MQAKIDEKTIYSLFFFAGDVWVVKPGLGGTTWNLSRERFGINITQLAAGK